MSIVGFSDTYRLHSTFKLKGFRCETIKSFLAEFVFQKGSATTGETCREFKLTRIMVLLIDIIYSTIYHNKYDWKKGQNWKLPI